MSVCGPGAYVVLKALAFRNRGENKDAYDLFYLLRSFEGGIDAVATALRPMLKDLDARRAMEILRGDFTRIDGPGPSRAATFIHGAGDDATQADVVGFVLQLLERVKEDVP